MQITRRQFVHYVAGAAAAMGLSQAAVMKLTEQLALGVYTKPSVIFLEGQVCGGCETSILQLRNRDVNHDTLATLTIPNTLGTASVGGLPAGAAEDQAWPVGDRFGSTSAVTIDDVLLDILDVKIIRIAGSPAGNLYTDTLMQYLPTSMGGGNTSFGVLVVTGSIPMGSGDAKNIGENASISAAKADGTALTSQDLVVGLASKAGAVIAAGTCASYGGVPAAANRNYDATTSRYKYNGASNVVNCIRSSGNGTVPIVRLPNCPVNPNVLYLTVAQYIVDVVVGGNAATFLARLTSDGRPNAVFSIPMYSDTIHSHCKWYNDYQGTGSNGFANEFGQQGCLLYKGCQGINTYGPCARGAVSSSVGVWNDFAQQYCPKIGSPCTGCAADGYPDKFSPLNTYDNSAGY